LYITGEVEEGQYSKEFEPDALEKRIGPFRTLPIGLCPKLHSSKLCMIQDLSFPRNNPTMGSVNADINSDDFPTEWGTFDQTAEVILSVPMDALMASIDISAAYCITPVAPAQQHTVLCVLGWLGLH
jgi:hypothetical protein